jgi:hypothetical protein
VQRRCNAPIETFEVERREARPQVERRKAGAEFALGAVFQMPEQEVPIEARRADGHRGTGFLQVEGD